MKNVFMKTDITMNIPNTDLVIYLWIVQLSLGSVFEQERVSLDQFTCSLEIHLIPYFCKSSTPISTLNYEPANIS
jgi:hypothetical protein